MILSSTDFETALSELEANDLSPGTVGQSMDATDYNRFMKNVETALNALYEKVRTLNDVYDYTENFVNKQIKEKTAAFQENLKIIEQLTSSYTDKEYVADIIPFTLSQDKVIDKNGNEVSIMNIIDGQLVAPGTVIEKATPVYTLSTCDIKEFDQEGDILDNILRVTYILEEPVANGIVKTYEIDVSCQTDINYLDIKAVNANVENIVLIDKSENETPVKNLYYIPVTAVDKIKFDLRCTEYENQLMENNTSIVSSLAVDKGYASGGSTINKAMDKMSDVDRLAMSGLYRGRYTTWKSTSTNIDNQNIISVGSEVSELSTTGGRNFSSDYIVTSSGGVIETLSATGFRYTPSNEIKQTEVVSGGNFMTEAMPEYEIKYRTGSAKNNYKYNFGIDSLLLEHKLIKDSFGFMSQEMNLGNASHIELSVDTDDFESMEFYIVEGADEVAILPIEQEIIKKEKLFSGETRFPIMTDKYVIYEDGVSTNLKVSELSTLDYINHDYRITYTPARKTVYISNKDTVKVKMVQYRVDVPAEIRTMSLRKYGGDINWTIWG